MPNFRRLSAALMALRLSTSLLLVLSTLLLVSGCTHTGQVAQPVTGLALAGRVHGGQQPVTGSTIQLYTVGTTGDGSASTPLLSKSVTTDTAGSFSITGDYTCPSSTALVYLTATGGNPGLAAGTSNPNLAMLAALGQCGQLSATMYVFVDEVTTVGTVAALYPYMTAYAATGSGSADLNAFTTAYSTVAEFTNIANGTAPGPALPSGYYASSTEIGTLGNILAPCVNSVGGTAGDGSLCGQLFQLARPPTGAAPTDTVTAILDILKNPTQNVAALFNLGQAAPPFQPALAAAPTDWTLTIVQVPATPTFSLAAGTYTGAQTVSLSDSVAGAAIYYSTDGTTPTKSSTLYSGSFTVSSSETVKAVAIDGGRSSSAVASAAYVIAASSTGVPVITTVSAVAAQQTQTITITGSGFGTKNAYTGSSNSISLIDANKAFQAGYGGDTVYLVINSWTDSQIVLGGFAGAFGTNGYTLSAGDEIELNIFNAQTGSGPGACDNIFVGSGATTCIAVAATATPVFSPAGGTYSSTQTVTITDATAGSTIYYTLDGSTPTSSSPIYSTPISIAASKTLNAYAFGFGLSASAVNSANYTINANAAGVISAYAGNVAGTFSGPAGVAIDSSGNVYVANSGSNTVSKVSPAGLVTTLAGNGSASSTGDGGLATAAGLYTPWDVAVDSSGNVYIADLYGNRVRKVTVATGIITTIAGNGTGGYNGDNIQGSTAEINLPYGLAVDASGNVFIAEFFGARIRKVTPSGIITTVAGYAQNGYNGDGIPATSASLFAPEGVAVDTSGNLYIADSGNQRVRKVTAATGLISTLAGTGTQGFSGDGGAATAAQVYNPEAIGIDSSGNLYFGDDNQRVRRVTTAGTITTIAGNGTAGFSGDGGPATSAEINRVSGLSVDPTGSLYLADQNNNRIRKVTFASAPQAQGPAFMPAAGSYASAQTVTLSSTTSGATLYYTLDGSAPTAASTRYIAPNVVSSTRTINAIALATGYTNSAVTSAAYTINIPTAATPTISPAGGTYTTAQTITLADATAGAALYYTLDGSNPTAASPRYTVPLTLSSSGTVSAIAIAAGYNNSAVVSAAYVINVTTAAAPTFSVPTGAYNGPQSVTLASTTAGATFYYTLDGSNPTTASTKYTGAITVNSSETISAIATATGYANSAPASATYTLQLLAPFAFATQDVSDFNITIENSFSSPFPTPTPSFYYTIDGSTPSATHGALYSNVFQLQPSSGAITLLAVAVEAGYATSPVTSLRVAFPTAAAPTISPAGGTFTTPVTVTLASASPGATYRYTTNGTLPSLSNGNLYTGAFTVGTTEVVQAITVSGTTYYTASAPTSASFTINLGPHITSVGAFVSGQTQTVIIKGSGFGNTGPTSPTSTQFRLRDNTNVWEAGYSPTPDVVGVGFSSWTDTQVVFTGFVGYYGSQNWTINPGDNLTITIWNGSVSGACSTINVGGGASTCP